MLRLLVVVIAFFGAISAVCGQSDSHSKLPSAEKVAGSEVTYKVIGTAATGYGYEVYSDKKKLIHQPTIPGRSGTTGFRTKADSEKVAKLVVEKLKRGEMPPTVTEEELRKLKVVD